MFNFNDLLNEESFGDAKRAKDAVYRARKAGKLKKPKRCSKCGKITSKLEFAHGSYKTPLKGRWLCKSCHGKDNKKQVKKRGYANGHYDPSGRWPKKYKKKT